MYSKPHENNNRSNSSNVVNRLSFKSQPSQQPPQQQHQQHQQQTDTSNSIQTQQHSHNNRNQYSSSEVDINLSSYSNHMPDLTHLQAQMRSYMNTTVTNNGHGESINTNLGPSGAHDHGHHQLEQQTGLLASHFKGNSSNGGVGGGYFMHGSSSSQPVADMNSVSSNKTFGNFHTSNAEVNFSQQMLLQHQQHNQQAPHKQLLAFAAVAQQQQQQPSQANIRPDLSIKIPYSNRNSSNNMVK